MPPAAMSKPAMAARLRISAAPQLDLKKTIAWKDGIVDRLNSGVAGLLARAKVPVVEGWATFSDAKTCTVETKDGPVTLTAEHVILAAGSQAVPLPMLPFGGNVISSTEALNITALPKHLAVVGAGYIGLELGIAFRKLGAEVTVIEMADRILPRYDAALTRPVRRWLERNKVDATSRRQGHRYRWRGPPRGRDRQGRDARARRRQDPGHRRPPAAHRRLGPGGDGRR